MTESRGVARWAAVVLLATALVSCDQAPPATGPVRSAMNATTADQLPETVTALPPFDFDRYERLLFELRGTPVVVNLWASWCGPCEEETPILAAAARRYGGRVQFLGVDQQDQRTAAAAFLDRYRVPYPSVSDASGAIHDRLGFVGLPDTVFYAADGSIAATWTGPISATDLRAKIEPLLDGL